MAYSDLSPGRADSSIAAIAPEDYFRLGMKHSTGRGAPFDLIKAHMWFNIAASKGIEAARRCRKELADHMTSAQVAMAQRAAREWLAAAR